MNRLLATLGCFLALVASYASAQITVVNTGSCPVNPFQTTTGTGILIDNTLANVQVGSGSAFRNASAGNASYLSTGFPLTPSLGFTIQWWTKTAAPADFSYNFGDSTMVAPSFATFSGGAFRCFQNGTNSSLGNLILRGVPVQIPTQATPTSGPLNVGGLGGGPNANGFVHLAVRYDPATNTGQWLVNGLPVGPLVAQTTGPFTWNGTNLTIVGYSGTASAGTQGNWDDIRIYNFARSNADIAADYLVAVPCSGPTIRPCHYFKFDGPSPTCLDLNVSQPTPGGSLAVINYHGIPGHLYFTAGTLDPTNIGVGFGSGPWFGLHISFFDVLMEWSTGAPPFVGNLDALGASSFVLPAPSLSALLGSGTALSAVTITVNPATGNISAISAPSQTIY